MGNVLNINTLVLQRMLGEHDALVRGVRQLFDANSMDEDHAARLVLLDVLRRISQHTKPVSEEQAHG